MNKTAVAKRQGAWGALGGLAFDLSPYVFALLAFAAGLLLLLSNATPAESGRLAALSRIEDTFVIELSHFLGSIVGLLLLLVATALWRRRSGAYWAALALLMAGAFFSMTKGLEYEGAGALLVIAAALVPCRVAFDRHSRLLAERLDPVWLGAAIAAVAASGWLGFFAFRHVAYSHDLWWTFLRDADASRFLRAGVAVALITLVAAVMTLFAPARPPWRARPSAEDIQTAAEIVQTAEYAPADAWLALSGDKDLLFSDSRASMLMFRVRGRHWIAMSEPAGLRSERRALMWRYVELSDQVGSTPVFYAISEDLLPDVAAMGLVIRQVGETALVPAQKFTLTGRARQDLRTALHHAEREGGCFEVLAPGEGVRSHMAELRAVSDAWLTRQTGAEKGFSLGRFDTGYIQRFPVAVVRVAGRIVAFATLMTSRSRGETSIDLMRQGADAPRWVMDMLFLKIVEWAKGDGLEWVNLGMAPLAGLENRRFAPLFARLGAFVYQQGGAVYGFEGLRKYKNKFGPEWRPLYMAARPGALMPLALLDVALLTSGGWRGMLLKD